MRKIWAVQGGCGWGCLLDIVRDTLSKIPFSLIAEKQNGFDSVPVKRKRMIWRSHLPKIKVENCHYNYEWLSFSTCQLVTISTSECKCYGVRFRSFSVKNWKLLRCGASSACGTSEAQITGVTDSLWSKICGASISDSSDKWYRVEDLHNATFFATKTNFRFGILFKRDTKSVIEIMYVFSRT